MLFVGRSYLLSELARGWRLASVPLPGCVISVGQGLAQACEEYSTSLSTLYRWWPPYGGYMSTIT